MELFLQALVFAGLIFVIFILPYIIGNIFVHEDIVIKFVAGLLIMILFAVAVFAGFLLWMTAGNIIILLLN